MAAPSPDIGVFTTDVSLVVRVWDDWLAAATGRAADDVRGRPLEEVVPDLAARGLLRYFHEVLATGAIQVLAPAFHHYLIPCPPRSPSRRFTEMQQRVTIGPLREDDRIVGTMATIEDVTARMEAERDIAESLTSADPDVRQRAAEALARLKETDADTVVRPLLAADDWRVRQAGVNGLARIADARFVAALVDTLRDEHRNFSVLSSALKLLSLTDLNVTGPVAALLQHRDTDLRIQAALALGDQQDTAAVPALLEALGDPDANVRFHAIESLGRLRSAAAVQPLLDIVESRDFFLAFAAIDALARIDDPGIAPRLVPLLADATLRAPIIDALGALGEDDVVAPLVRTLNDVAEDATAIAAALASIHQRSERQYGAGSGIEDVVCANVTDTGVRHLLGSLGAATPSLLPAVVTVLGWLDSPEVDRALTRLLGDADARGLAVEALARHGRRVVPLLIEQVDADDRATRLAAITALGRVADRRATAALLGGLDDDAEVQVATAGALARIADPAAFEPLVALVSHRDAAVRLAAIGALNSIGHPDMPQRIVAMLSRRRRSHARVGGANRRLFRLPGNQRPAAGRGGGRCGRAGPPGGDRAPSVPRRSASRPGARDGDAGGERKDSGERHPCRGTAGRSGSGGGAEAGARRSGQLGEISRDPRARRASRCRGGGGVGASRRRGPRDPGAHCGCGGGRSDRGRHGGTPGALGGRPRTRDCGGGPSGAGPGCRGTDARGRSWTRCAASPPPGARPP